MVNHIYKDLYNKDSSRKNVSIVFDDGEITNAELYAEGMELKEQLCSDTTLRFGACEASTLKLKIANVYSGFKGKWLTVTEGITVGGRNLLKKKIGNSKNCKKIDELSIQILAEKSDTYFYLYTWEDLDTETEYTFSCDASGVPDGYSEVYNIGSQSNSNFSLIVDKNGRLSCTGKFQKEIGAGEKVLLDDINTQIAPSQPFILSNFKLEKGNKATDYTPAPEDTLLQLGKYKVYSDVPSGDRNYRNITAYDSMYDIINSDVSMWYESLSFPISIKQFRDSFFDYMDIKQEDAVLVNDDLMIEKTVDVESISGSEVVSSVCELNGVFGHINRYGEFTYISLEKSNSEKINVGKLYKTCEFEDFITKSYTGVHIRESENDIGGSYGEDGNCYIIQDNFLVYGKNTDELSNIAEKIFEKIHDVSYRPFNAVIPGNPYNEVGDCVHIDTRNGVVESYLLERTLTGIQALFDSVEAKGTYEVTTEQKSIEKQVIQLKGKTNTLERTVEETVMEIKDLEKEVDSKISVSAEEIKTEVSKTYATKENVDNLQQQIDGAVETFSGSSVPTIFNEPANEWSSDEEKDTHIGDLYIVNSDGGPYAGFYYRFEKSDDDTYRWTLLKDNEITKALQDAKEANEKANQNAAGIKELSTSITQTNEKLTSEVRRVDEMGKKVTILEQNSSGFEVRIEKVEKNAIVEEEEEYYQSTSATELSGGSWSSTQPTWTQGKYIFKRTKITYGDGSTEYNPNEKGVCVTGNTGLTGQKGEDGKGVKSTSVNYQTGSSGVTIPTGEWEETIQKTTAEKPYLWTRTIITYTDDTTSTSYAIGSTIEGITVGGRNLLKKKIGNSKNCKKIDELSIQILAEKSDTYFYLYTWEDLDTETEYTFSCDASGVPDGYSEVYNIGSQSNSNFSLIVDKNGRLSCTGKFQKEIGAGEKVLLDDINTQIAPSQPFILSNFKLEKGNKATDYTPAPEDVELEIEESSKTATNFMGFDSTDGLQIGNKTSGSWSGFRTQITSTAFNILNDVGEVLASYGEKLIELGKNATNAVISLCGGKGRISYDSETDTMQFYGDDVVLNGENTAGLYTGKIADGSTLNNSIAEVGDGYSKIGNFDSWTSDAKEHSYGVYAEVTEDRKYRVYESYTVDEERLSEEIALEIDFLNVKPIIKFNNQQYGYNEKLWSGKAIMIASDTVNLSQKISDQANGIVLVFNYSNSNVGWHAFFIPKYAITISDGGYDWNFDLSSTDGSVRCGKSIYISDSYIKGTLSNGNSYTDTSTGVKYTNDAYMLRYVIGV